jgi:dienelactone hydrolase
MLRKHYQRWMHAWETRLTERDTNRVVRPFDWGLEWTRGWHCVNGNFPSSPHQAERFLCDLNDAILADSESFFACKTPTDFRLEQRLPQLFATGTDREEKTAAYNRKRRPPAKYLRFTSPARTPYPENDLVNARWFPARGRRAVIVLPQWNSDAESHNVLCRGFNLMGIAALRLSMPYHDIRMPKELQRADYAVSANIGRTIDAARQAVLDIRCCLDWLESEGYTQLGIMGTSLGSCYAFIASAHDPRLKVNVFNHASTYFADVVWTGQSTRHIRAGIEPVLDLERLRRVWAAVSPAHYFQKFASTPKKSLVIYAKYDLTFLPEFSEKVAHEFMRHELDHRIVVLPCGHYTTGETPYKYLDGWQIMQFLRTAF